MKTQGAPRLVALAHIYWSSTALPVSYGGFKLHRNSVSKGGSPHHHGFTVASERMGEFSWAVSAGAENSGEKSAKTFAVLLMVPCDRGKWLVSVDEFISSWRYGPMSGTLKSQRQRSMLSWWPGHSLGSHHKEHLAANGDNSCCFQGSCECLQMGSDVLVSTMGRGLCLMVHWFPLIRLSSRVTFLYITRKMWRYVLQWVCEQFRFWGEADLK